MKVFSLLIVFFVCLASLKAQPYYFPPLTGTQWESVSPGSLGWCTGEIDTLIEFLEENNTKAFILLLNGKESLMLPDHRS